MSTYSVTYNAMHDYEAGCHPTTRVAIPAPTPRAEQVLIPKHDGNQYIYDGTNDISIKIEFGFHSDTPETYNDVFTAIKAWIYSNGAGELWFSDIANVYRKVKFVYIESHERLSKRIGKLSVVFVCDPFQYIRDEGYQELQESGSIYNQYNATAHPNFRITGNGDCTITINGKSFTITVNGLAAINTDLMYCMNENNVNVNTIATGDYDDLWLKYGANPYSITSGFTVLIDYCWRVL